MAKKNKGAEIKAKKAASKKKKDFKSVHHIKKKALKDYGQYLIDQLEYASKKDIRKQYKKFILDQLAIENKTKAKKSKKK